MIRKFYLINSEGIPYYFDYRQSTLITQLDGLGFENEISYLKYANFYDSIEKVYPLSQIKASLIFLKGYTGYTLFLDYLKSSKDLKLFYEADKVMYCNIEVRNLTKGELVSGCITSIITLDKLSPWLRESIYEVKVKTDFSGKIYPYSYSYLYTTSFEGKIKIKNNGAFSAPMKVDIYGEVNNPELRVLKNGVTITSLKLYLTSLNSIITVNANPTNQYIKMIEGDAETNIYSLQDFSKNNFLFIDSGEYDLEFIPGVNSDTRCIITILESYLG